ncbi:MAG: ComF family protein [Candidatus Cryptobacteroides sp.]
MEVFRFVMRAVADFFFPGQCLVCGGFLPAGREHLCADCAGDIPLTYYWDRGHNPMADRLNELIQRDLDAGDFQGTAKVPYSNAAALFFFRTGSGYRHICHQLKYHRNIRAGREFAGMLAQRLAGSEFFRDADVVVPVPLHTARKFRRGYNQAEVIAEEVARGLGARMCPQMLRRRRRTGTQTRLGLEEKRRNVSGAFVFGRFEDGGRCGQAGKSPSHILVVDDVFTTGATANACVKVLREKFGQDVRISVATLAAVGDI